MVVNTIFCPSVSTAFAAPNDVIEERLPIILNLTFAGSVKDSLLSSQSMVTLLAAKVSEAVSTAEQVRLDSEKADLEMNGPFMSPEMQRLVDNYELTVGSASGSAPTAAAHFKKEEPGKLSVNHVKMLRQMSEVSDMAKDLMSSLEQCVMVMFQQEDYRLGQCSFWSSIINH